MKFVIKLSARNSRETFTSKTFDSFDAASEWGNAHINELKFNWSIDEKPLSEGQYLIPNGDGSSMVVYIPTGDVD